MAKNHMAFAYAVRKWAIVQMIVFVIILFANLALLPFYFGSVRPSDTSINGIYMMQTRNALFVAAGVGLALMTQGLNVVSMGRTTALRFGVTATFYGIGSAVFSVWLVMFSVFGGNGPIPVQFTFIVFAANVVCQPCLLTIFYWSNRLIQ